jgi:hypothetical protein
MPFVMETVAVDSDKDDKESDKSKCVPFGIKGFLGWIKIIVFADHKKSSVPKFSGNDFLLSFKYIDIYTYLEYEGKA